MTDLLELESLVRVVEGGDALTPAQTESLADGLAECSELVVLQTIHGDHSYYPFTPGRTRVEVIAASLREKAARGDFDAFEKLKHTIMEGEPE